MVKLAYVNTDNYSVGVYDDFLLEYQAVPLRRPDGTLILRAPDGYVSTVELDSVTHLLHQAGYSIVEGSWEILADNTARAVVTSDTAGYQPREHPVQCPYGPPGHTTWHHTGICEEHWVYRTFP